MIYTKTPLRVSLFGGGTDFPEYFLNHQSKVVGFTINQYVWIFSNSIIVDQGFRYRLSYRLNQDVNDPSEIAHPLLKAVLCERHLKFPTHISTMSDFPAGSGLGSSSSFAVGLIALLDRIEKKTRSNYELAMEAVRYERYILGESGGWQDQFHAAYGGINTSNFGHKVTVDPIQLSKKNFERISDSLYLVYTELLRHASEIEAEKQVKSKRSIDILRGTYEIACQGEEILRSDTIDLAQIGELLKKGWKMKRILSKNVSNEAIDKLYNSIIDSGAYGAKLCGAGGGGFFLVVAKKESIENLKRKTQNITINKLNTCVSGVEYGGL